MNDGTVRANLDRTNHGADSRVDDNMKACCAALYTSGWVRLLLGDSFHPGGLALTERLGQLLDLQPSNHLLDVAAGQGASALFLAQHFGCQVTGLDYSQALVAQANTAAAAARLTSQVRFQQGDAENLPFADQTFDVIICECAFCTFPRKQKAVTEFLRVLRPGGQIGLSDLTRSGPLPAELEGVLAWITCIADAQPLSRYEAYLEDAGITLDQVETHNTALSEMIGNVRARLLGAELLARLKNVELPGADLGQAKHVVRKAAETVEAGRLGYAILTGTKTRA